MQNTLRISGLVKSQTSVRSLLALGTSGGAAAALHQAKNVTDEVLAICAKHGVDPAELPLPSHKAFSYLLAIANGESHQEALMAPHLARFSNRSSSRNVGYLGKEAGAIARLMWKRRDEFLRDRNLLSNLGLRINSHREEVASKLPQDMKIESLTLANAAYVMWLDFLLARDHLKGSIKVLVRAARAFKEVCDSGVALPEILLVPAAEAYLEVEHEIPSVWRVSMEFYGAPKRIWKALAKHALSAEDAESRQVVETFLLSTAGEQYRRMLVPACSQCST